MPQIFAMRLRRVGRRPCHWCRVRYQLEQRAHDGCFSKVGTTTTINVVVPRINIESMVQRIKCVGYFA